MKDKLENGGKKREKGRRDDVVEERETARKSRRQSGEEDEVRPAIGFRNPNRTPSLRSAQNLRYPQPKHPAFNREPAHQPAARHPRVSPSPRGPSPAFGPRPASGPLTRASTRDACTRVALGLCHVSRLQRGSSRLRQLHRLGGSGGLFGSENLFPARLTPF